MVPNVDEARELMAEGDRLLGRAWEQAPSSKRGLSSVDLALAEHYYGQAAQAYLVGAAEYQHGRAATPSGAAMEDPNELINSLEGRLRIEAESALRSASGQAPDDSPGAAVGRAQTFAEELRDRFAHAAPELFHGHADFGPPRTEGADRSR
jgi:hypothetical protein